MRPPQSTPNAACATFTWAWLTLGALGLAGLSGCTAPPSAPRTASQTPSTPAASPPAADSASVRPEAAAPNLARQGPITSRARSAKDYRKDAASHLYALNHQHIYQGRLPPMLQAVGVLNVDIDRHGSVKSVKWMRAPRHVPEVMQQIEHMVKAAEPYPVPVHMSQVTYTDVWLWHQSGKFQLDTLTEGQD